MNSLSEPSIKISEGVCDDTTLCDLELDKTFIYITNTQWRTRNKGASVNKRYK